MIIVTGCDNTGKSTLIKHISEKFHIPVAERFKPLPPEGPNDYGRWYAWVKCQFNKKEELIYDRLFIDELVYGPVRRKGYGISIAKMAELSTMMLMKQPLYIYTYLAQNEILKGWSEREQYIKAKEIGSILSKFNRVNHMWPITQLQYQYRFDYTQDYDYSGVDEMVEFYKRGVGYYGECSRF